VKSALDSYDSILSNDEIPLSMLFEEGDIQFISNHHILHSRGSYVDSPGHVRHLLRLWITLDSSHTFSERLFLLPPFLFILR